MTEEEAKNGLFILLNTDIRLQVHSWCETKKDVFKHTKSCPRCCAMYVLGYPQEMLDNRL